MNECTVSVIVPVYNAVHYLQECADSVLNQTMQNVELILVNDGSTDGSAALCDAIAAQDSRVKALHQPCNKGVSAARNRGIDSACGTYCFFADADDTLNPEAIAFLVGLIQEYPNCDVAACGYYINGKAEKDPNKTPVVWQRDVAITAIFDYNISAVKGVLWNKLFRRSVIWEQGLRFDEEVHICEDLLFCLQYLLCSNRMVYHSVPQYRYVRRSGSAMHSPLTVRRVSVLSAYQKMMSLVNPLGRSVLSDMLRINYLNHHLHMLQITWKVRDAQTMQVAGQIYRSFRPQLGWFLRQKEARLKRKLIALFFWFTAFQFPKD